MFREMRRVGKKLTEQDINDVLTNSSTGVLAVLGDDDYPYAVPLNYVYVNNKLYFHCANEGHKLDSIRKVDKVSFAIIDKDEVLPRQFNTLFRSVIVFGRARIISDAKEKRDALTEIIKKYSKDYHVEGQAYIDKFWDKCETVEITPEHISGKESK